jgi:AcrR family transcriptional regulator
LVEATAAHAKKKGFAATGIDGLMASVGLTSGAFYSHFRSKNELLEAIIQNELARSAELFAGKTVEQAMMAIEDYLSPAHVEQPELGCAVPALASEIARAGDSTQGVFEVGMIELKNQISALVNDEAKAWSIIAQLVGAVTVARGMPAGVAREALLQGVTKQVKQLLLEIPQSSSQTSL